MAYNNLANPSNYQQLAFGEGGFRLITAASTPVAGERYRVVYALEDSTVSVTSEAGDSLDEAVLFIGVSIYGVFSEVTCSSGSVLAYIG